MKWFRYWSEALTDPKVQLLPVAAFKGWVNLLCIVNETEPSRGKNSGYLPADVQGIAYKLRLSLGATNELLSELVAAGLFEEHKGRFRAHNWPVRQPVSDNVTERVRETRRKQPRNVSETKLHGERTASETEEKERRGDPEADAEEIQTQTRANFAAPEANGSAPQPQRRPAAPSERDWEEVRHAFELKLGLVTTVAREKLRAYLTQMPKDWILASIEETTKAKNPGFPYLDSVLERCLKTNEPPSSLKKPGALGLLRQGVELAQKEGMK